MAAKRTIFSYQLTQGAIGEGPAMNLETYDDGVLVAFDAGNSDAVVQVSMDGTNWITKFTHLGATGVEDTTISGAWKFLRINVTVYVAQLAAHVGAFR